MIVIAGFIQGEIVDSKIGTEANMYLSTPLLPYAMVMEKPVDLVSTKGWPYVLLFTAF